MKAVVMAGGEGSRLRPLTVSRPKPMVPIVGRPVMEHILNLLKRHGITDVVVTVQYMASAIEDYFGDGAQFGMHTMDESLYRLVKDGLIDAEQAIGFAKNPTRFSAML